MTGHHLPKQDARPMRGGWAPGNYGNFCCDCGEEFLGDKRAVQCADCAYATGRKRVAVVGIGVAGVGLVELLQERLNVSPDLVVEVVDDTANMTEVVRAIKLRNVERRFIPDLDYPPEPESFRKSTRGGHGEFEGSRKKGGRRRWGVPR